MLLCCCCCCCYTKRLRMILSSAWSLVGDWVSSAILLPKDCLLLYISMAGHAIHRCRAVSSSSLRSLQDGSSSSPIMDLHDLSLGWWPDLNLTRFTLSSLLIPTSSSSLILSGSLSSMSRVLSAYLLPTSSLMTTLLVLWSSGTSACWRMVPSFALSSASSLPSRPQCDGTQSTSSLPLTSASFSSLLRVSNLRWEVSPPRASTSDLLSVTMAALLQSRVRFSQVAASSIAVSLAAYDEHLAPAGTDHCLMVSSPVLTTTPVPPVLVPSTTEPSV